MTLVGGLPSKTHMYIMQQDQYQCDG